VGVQPAQRSLYGQCGPCAFGSKELLDFREAVLSAAEDSPALAERLFRSMNLVDPPTDYSPLLT
jgi:hypothetical protein